MFLTYQLPKLQQGRSVVFFMLHFRFGKFLWLKDFVLCRFSAEPSLTGKI